MNAIDQTLAKYKVRKSMNAVLKMPVLSFKEINGIPQNAICQFANHHIGYRVFQTENNRYVYIDGLGAFKCLYS